MKEGRQISLTAFLYRGEPLARYECAIESIRHDGDGAQDPRGECVILDLFAHRLNGLADIGTRTLVQVAVLIADHF